MRRSLLTLALVATTAVAAACGSDGDSGASFSEAAAATAEAKTARMTVRATVSGAGLPVPLTVRGRGVTATETPRADLTLDLAPLLRLANIQTGDGALRVIVPGGADVFVDPPTVPGVEVPGGDRFVSLDLAAVARAAGVEPAGIGDILRLDPAAQLRVLRSASSIEEVGEEEVGGEPTTHYRGRIRLSDYVRGLPAERRQRAERALRQFERATDSPDEAMPVELWIDEDGLARRFRQTTSLPAPGGQPGGRVETVYELSDFGARLNVTTPPATQTYDATGAVSRAIRQGALAGAAGGGAG